MFSLSSHSDREKYMVTVPIYVATVFAFLNALVLAAVYIPSTVTTILRLRCGDIQTLRNNDFKRFRWRPEEVALLTGSLFWGSLFSSALVGGGIGLVVFFFVSFYHYPLPTVEVPDLCPRISSIAVARNCVLCTTPDSNSMWSC